MDTRTHDELSIMLDQEEYDDISVAESLISETQRDTEQTVQVFSISSLSFTFDSLSRISLSLSLVIYPCSHDESSSSISHVASFDRLSALA